MFYVPVLSSINYRHWHWVHWVFMIYSLNNVCIPLYSIQLHINTLRPKQNGRHFPNNIFKCLFLKENSWISIRISLKFLPKVPINYKPALVQIMTGCLTGDKPLFEPMMGYFTDTYMRHSALISWMIQVSCMPHGIRYDLSRQIKQIIGMLFNIKLNLSLDKWWLLRHSTQYVLKCSSSIFAP